MHAAMNAYLEQLQGMYFRKVDGGGGKLSGGRDFFFSFFFLSAAAIGSK